MSDSLAPGLLVAVPQLVDPNFKQSVIFLLEATEEGAFGVVVNRESSILLSDLCGDHEIEYSGKTPKHVRRGGPVQPEQGIVVYGIEHEDPEGREVCDGLFVSASRGTLSRLCELDEGRFHCYAGYAGWGPGQLEQEIEEGSWIYAPADAQSVLDLDPDEMWDAVLRAQGIEPGALASSGFFATGSHDGAAN
jgi:putative transcriptional regulator